MTEWIGEANGLRKRYVFAIWELEIIINLDKYKVTDTVKDLESEGDHVIRFSVTGYSLGGLVARYMIGCDLTCAVRLQVSQRHS